MAFKHGGTTEMTEADLKVTRQFVAFARLLAPDTGSGPALERQGVFVVAVQLLMQAMREEIGLSGLSPLEMSMHWTEMLAGLGVSAASVIQTHNPEDTTGALRIVSETMCQTLAHLEAINRPQGNA